MTRSAWSFCIKDPLVTIGGGTELGLLVACLGVSSEAAMSQCRWVVQTLSDHKRESEFIRQTFGELNPLMYGEHRLFLVDGAKTALDVDFIIVPLHLNEMGLSPTEIETLLRARPSGYDAIEDPRGGHDDYFTVARLVRSARRLVKLKELEGPQIIITNEAEILGQKLDDLGASLEDWILPKDVFATVQRFRKDEWQ